MLDDRRGSRFELAQIATLFWACLVVCHAFAAEKPAPAAPRKERLKPISFNRDIRPILSDRCFGCHGPDPASREADLRLDQAEGDSGAHSWAIEPGSPADSELWARITSNDDSDRMPPPDSHKERLSQSELALVRRWINDGAHYEKFWAFEPAVWAKPPTVEDSAWQQPIDAFVLDRILSDQARPAANATPRMLIRRVTFDVTGLPPTREEISRFLVEVEQQSFDKAYEALVDRLIASPRYGEHMARYWLDLVRFADTNGIHKDFYRNHVAYRDWVIRAFNSNLGYDDFLRYQLAGDLYDTPTRDQLVASGFNRLHLIIDRGTALPEESFHRNVVDRVTAVSTAFMGLTVQCAQCHDHKYDPITQEDFYSLYAFFNNIDTNPETTYLPHRGLQQPFVSLASSEQQATLSDLDKAIAAVDRRIGEIEALVGGDEATLPAELQSLKAQRKRLRSRRARLDDSIPYAMVAKERSEVRKTCLLERGEYDSPGKEVQRNTPAFLFPITTTGSVASRKDLAEWFTDRRNPLTARVAVNRFWQQFFGIGLVKTSEDFGAQGEPPSHPKLLDFLASTFVDSGWDIKALVRQVVMSRTYRQTSAVSKAQYAADPENRLLARGSRFRMDAEMIRDQILMTSGLLSGHMYGPSVKPPQPPGLWKAVSMIGETYIPDKGELALRRSVYTFWKRAMPPPQMTILDAPDRNSCIARRERTNTPTQALLLLNEPEYFRAAKSLAMRVLEHPADQRIAFAWETVTSRLPDAEEIYLVKSLLEQMEEHYRRNPKLLAKQPKGVVGSKENDPVELAAWTVVNNTLYNLDITKTRE